jgi:hypothetical protein
MARCFIIQPFDNDKFDARYKETFKPAIEEAGFEPYRVDEDVSVLIPINDIEQGIKSATVCFAEISKDNAILLRHEFKFGGISCGFWSRAGR